MSPGITKYFTNVRVRKTYFSLKAKNANLAKYQNFRQKFEKFLVRNGNRRCNPDLPEPPVATQQ